jgi:hypothetical protein
VGRALGEIVEELAAGLSFAVVVGVVASGCNHASKASAPGCCDRAESTRGGETGPDSRLGAEPGGPSAPTASPRFRKEEGCARDFKSNGAPRDDIARLERLCAQGMVPLLPEPVSATASPAGVVEVPFKVASAGCLRGGAVAPAGALSIAFFDPRGASLISASSTEPLGVVPVDGTICVREPGAYRAVVRLSPAPSEATNVTVQIWQASRD